MKVALVHPAFGAWGGAENLLAWLAGGLAARRHEVVVFSGAWSDQARATLSATGARVETLTHMHGKPWERLQVGAGGIRTLPLADHVVRLDRAAMDWHAASLAARWRGFDAVVTYNFPSLWWVDAARRAAPAGFPRVIWYCNEPSRSLYPGLFAGPSFKAPVAWNDLQSHDRRAAASADLIVGNSRYVRDRIAAIYGREDAAVLYCGVPMPAEDASRGDGAGILMVTRLTREKNVACAVEAVARIPEARLRVAGTGPEQEALLALVAERGLEGRVTFEGFCSEARLAELYREAAVFVYLPIGEPFGLVLVEAGAAGLPSVTSRHGGPAEIVVDGETGLLVDPAAPEEVAGALRRLLADPAGARRMGEAARRRARERFSLDAFLDGFERLL